MRDEFAADGSQDRSQPGEWRRTVCVVRLGARTDRVRREALEDDERGNDKQTKAEQPPVRRRAPDAPPAERAQGFCPIFLPGTVVVVAAVVVCVCLTCPGAATDFPRVVEVDVWPGATPERPGDVVVSVVFV